MQKCKDCNRYERFNGRCPECHIKWLETRLDAEVHYGSEMRRICDAKNKELSALRSERTELKARVAEVEQSVYLRDNEINDLKAALAVERHSACTAWRQVEIKDTQNVYLEADIACVKASSAKRIKELEDRLSQSDEALKQLTALQSECDRLVAELVALRGTLSRVRKEVS